MKRIYIVLHTKQTSYIFYLLKIERSYVPESDNILSQTLQVKLKYSTWKSLRTFLLKIRLPREYQRLFMVSEPNFVIL